MPYRTKWEMIAMNKGQNNDIKIPKSNGPLRIHWSWWLILAISGANSPAAVPPSKGRSTTGFNTLTSCRPAWNHQPELIWWWLLLFYFQFFKDSELTWDHPQISGNISNTYESMAWFPGKIAESHCSYVSFPSCAEASSTFSLGTAHLDIAGADWLCIQQFLAL